jgi:hypothetical protein
MVKGSKKMTSSGERYALRDLSKPNLIALNRALSDRIATLGRLAHETDNAALQAVCSIGQENCRDVLRVVDTLLEIRPEYLNDHPA